LLRWWLLLLLQVLLRGLLPLAVMMAGDAGGQLTCSSVKVHPPESVW
jgi:hypothetical protein